MSNPLSIAASVAGLISLGIQVMQSLIDFYTLYKHQESDLVNTIEKLESLVDIFQELEKTLVDRGFSVCRRICLHIWMALPPFLEGLFALIFEA